MLPSVEKQRWQPGHLDHIGDSVGVDSVALEAFFEALRQGRFMKVPIASMSMHMRSCTALEPNTGRDLRLELPLMVLTVMGSYVLQQWIRAVFINYCRDWGTVTVHFLPRSSAVTSLQKCHPTPTKQGGVLQSCLHSFPKEYIYICIDHVTVDRPWLPATDGADKH